MIGHSLDKQGASNPTTGMTEYLYNERLAKRIADRLAAVGDEPVIVYRDVPYSRLPEKVNSVGADVVVSLHCNAFDTQASGSEALHYATSQTGKTLARSILDEVVSTLGLADRGVKACHEKDRGGMLLRYTWRPCVILEPFFIDNDSDLRVGVDKYDELADAICRGLVNTRSML